MKVESGVLTIDESGGLRETFPSLSTLTTKCWFRFIMSSVVTGGYDVGAVGWMEGFCL